jgi:hypothetical protein
MAFDFSILALSNHIHFAIFPNLPTDFLCFGFRGGYRNTALRLFPLYSPTLFGTIQILPFLAIFAFPFV